MTLQKTRWVNRMIHSARTFFIRTLFLLGILACVLWVLDVLFPTQAPRQQTSTATLHQDFSVVVYADDGTPLRTFADKDGIWRQRVSLDDVSPLYVEALLGYEDQWFWQHPGVNPIAIARAFYLNVKCGCIVSGGSTITMQVARRFHPMRRTVWGKFTQMLRALQLEWHFSKRDILELYLNYTAFGGTLEGVESASHAYLEKPAKALTHADAALLAVLPQAPSRLRPDRHPERAQRARDKVLNRLAQQNIWSDKVIQDAKLERVYATKPERPNFAPLFARWVKTSHPNLNTIRTTIDAPLQQHLQDDLHGWVSQQPKGTSVGVLVVDNHSAHIKAYVGTAQFADTSRYGYVDMVQATRSPGSTLKPFIYAMAIEQGLIHSHSLLSDAPRNFAQYRPENFNQSFSGAVSATQALQRSLNVPAVQVLSHVGASTFDARLRSAGIHVRWPSEAKPNLSMALGGVGLDLWQLTHAYAALANGGQVRALKAIKTGQGAVPVGGQRVSNRFLTSPEAAWITYTMLAKNTRMPAALQHRTRRDNRAYELAWKTGTSYGYRDAWAMGVSSQYTVGVWVGRPDGTPQPGVYGAISAAPLLFRIADGLHSVDTPNLKKPDGVERAEICWPLGQAKTRTLPEHCHRTHTAFLNQGLQPKTWDEWNTQEWQANPMTLWVTQNEKYLVGGECKPANTRIKKSVVALWPRSVEPWLPARLRRASVIPKPHPDCPSVLPPHTALTLVGIDDGNTFLAPRDESELPKAMFSATGGAGKRDWFVNGQYVFSTYNEQSVPYQFTKTGQHQIVVVDASGMSDAVKVWVKRGMGG